jgi:two-component system, cell cycle response regulator CtrA
MRALIVEREIEEARELSLLLRSGGGVVDQVDNGEDGIELASRYDYDIILLELVLSGIKGYEIVHRMRHARIETPVIVLSGLSCPQAKVNAFAQGADDFVTKPYDGAELLARAQAVVRRSKGFSQAILQAGPLCLDLHRHEVSVGSNLLHLTNKEYAILELLMLRKGMALSKEAFLNHLYGGMDEPEVKIIDVFVCKLRKKLAQAGADNLITTIWGRGYKLRCQVRASAESGRMLVPDPQLKIALRRVAALGGKSC